MNFDLEKAFETIKNEGAIYFKDLLSKEDIEQLLNDFDHKNNFFVQNQNDISFFENQSIVTHPLLRSYRTLELLSNDILQNLLNKLLHKPRITSLRYYETYRGGKGNTFLWHHDEKKESNNINSILMIIYLNDIYNLNEGAFQYIRSSHLYSKNFDDLKSRPKKYKDFFKKNIEEEYKQSIVSVFGKAGTVILADGRVIHKAHPRLEKNCRKVLMAQFKNIKNDTAMTIINSKFLNDKILNSPQLKYFFGVGESNNGTSYPDNLQLKEIPFKFIYFIIFFKWFMIRIYKYIKRINKK